MDFKLTPNCFFYQEDTLFIEKISFEQLAYQYDTPTYFYSKTQLKENLIAYKIAFKDLPHKIFYSVKANSNIAILNILHKLGTGFDIVSLGELKRVIAAGAEGQDIIFSGVGKTRTELKAALEYNIHCINVESIPEIFLLNEIAEQLNKKAFIAFRINPDSHTVSHPYISTGSKENKFGISIDDLIYYIPQILKLKHLTIIGIGFHVGSQLLELSPIKNAFDKILILIERLKEFDINIQHIDVGGGLGINYNDESPPSLSHYAHLFEDYVKKNNYQLYLEPGRSIIANTGALLSQISYIKETAHKNFAILDAGMNDLIRPALYKAFHKILPVKNRSTIPLKNYDIVGPICESGDFLAKNCALRIQNEDLLVIKDVGAYGFSMSSEYNSRPKPAEVIIEHDKSFLVKPRQTHESLFETERLIP
ncbi:MAG: lysA [Francisellaceae bacterium]|nr:lysA [Francisellaceae bacterium]